MPYNIQKFIIHYTIKKTMSYLNATNDLYKNAALTPDVGLCCTTTPIWKFPGLEIPMIMQEMNYGCGSTISAQDLVNNPKVLYVGVGGGGLRVRYFSPLQVYLYDNLV